VANSREPSLPRILKQRRRDFIIAGATSALLGNASQFPIKNTLASGTARAPSATLNISIPVDSLSSGPVAANSFVDDLNDRMSLTVSFVLRRGTGIFEEGLV
jgi:hypothetical protein